MDAATRSAARPIALARVVAEVMQEAGLVPKEFNAKALAARWWAETNAGEAAQVSPVDRAVALITERIVALQGSEIVDFGDRDEARREVIGYSMVPREEFDEGGRRLPGNAYVLRASALSKMAPTVSAKTLWAALDDAGMLIRHRSGLRTWNGYPGLARGVPYVVLRAEMVEAGEEPAPRRDRAPEKGVQLAAARRRRR